MSVEFSLHAETRMAQRAISSEAIELALRYGRVFYCAGARHIFLAARDLPAHLRRQQERLEGITLVMDPVWDVIITAYRNREASARIKRLDKQDRSRRKRALLALGIA
ncbi:MAG: DUF4258 domain-containing protein [Candidatus Sericytochromatia bacterium]|nr:DUF4258 domain-containing protein [Candidatus Sericytochromatia bacterium]